MEVLQTSALPLGYAASAFLRQSRHTEAGDRARTGDPNLGKVVLYQLSYTRIVVGIGGNTTLISEETITNSFGLSNEKPRAGDDIKTSAHGPGKAAAYCYDVDRAPGGKSRLPRQSAGGDTPVGLLILGRR